MMVTIPLFVGEESLSPSELLPVQYHRGPDSMGQKVLSFRPFHLPVRRLHCRKHFTDMDF